LIMPTGMLCSVADTLGLTPTDCVIECASQGYEHQVAHHMTPNEYTKDNDCEIGNPLFRFHPLIADLDDQKGLQKTDYQAAYRTSTPSNNGEHLASAAAARPPPVTAIDRWCRSYQHIIVPLAMSIGFFKWFLNDIEFFIRGRAGNVIVPTTLKLWCQILTGKFLWLLIHVVVPWYYYGGWYTLATVFIFMAFGAEYLENTFIVNHIQEECQVPMVELGKQRMKLQHQQQQQMVNGDDSSDQQMKSIGEARPLQLHWATQQVCTTTNWASRSHLCNFLSGGLNHQIEHHLFPTMSTCMYPLIAPIVERTCKEFNLPYHNYATFGEAWIDMYHYLQKLGNPEKEIEIKKVM
jgi:hypothetical protein